MTPDETPTTTKKRSRKAAAPRKAKTLDPGIAAIRERMAGEVAAYRIGQKSGGVLERIQKLILRLTLEDRQKLFDELSKTETASLLPRPVAQPNPDSLERAHRYAETLPVKDE